MKCPYCQADNDRVIDSRSGEEGFAIRRRRHCLSCDKRFTTYERVAELDIRVVKKDQTREVFQPEKIRSGIERACWKRPIPTNEVARVDRGSDRRCAAVRQRRNRQPRDWFDDHGSID